MSVDELNAFFNFKSCQAGREHKQRRYAVNKRQPKNSKEIDSGEL
jgi:hypothetical protein